ncbi:hypothetical protein DRN67_01290 [Candidatus Micrarchaeota archaeon]|nr:MAG: hypothetical protein DRN67_01290 [Candidatus Micrarchaeota archaeon]
MIGMIFLIPGPLRGPITRSLRGLGARIAAGMPNLKYNLKFVSSDYDASEYIILSGVSALVVALLFYPLMLFLFQSREMALDYTVYLPSIAAFVLVIFYYARWPYIQMGKKVEAVEKELTYALRELLTAMNAGASLYKAMEMVAGAGHGKVSEEFDITVRDINAGVPAEEALERMALRTESQFLKKMLWQMIGVLKSGASMHGALESMQESVQIYQQNQVTKYTQEMNLWILLYIVIGIAIPSLGATMLVVLSIFSGAGLTEYAMGILLLGCFIAEAILIKYMKVKRPVMY